GAADDDAADGRLRRAGQLRGRARRHRDRADAVARRLVASGASLRRFSPPARLRGLARWRGRARAAMPRPGLVLRDRRARRRPRAPTAPPPAVATARPPA